MPQKPLQYSIVLNVDAPEDHNKTDKAGPVDIEDAPQDLFKADPVLHVDAPEDLQMRQ